MLKPLTIAKKTFATNLIQGPLAGVSNAPFRVLMSRYLPPAFAYTEMISCKTLLHQPRASQQFMAKFKEEAPVCFQLSGHEPSELAEAVKRVTDAGADLIDLNCGCPVKKIRSKGAGSRLLNDPLKLYQLILTMKQHTTLPVSIKIRVDGNSTDKNNAEIVKVVREGGADFITVHGRHWMEHYETPCHYGQIQFFAEELSIPVIGNGDVACYRSLNKMLATGVSGVMIGRAGVGQPWLIQKLHCEINQRSFKVPEPDEVKNLFVEHVERLILLIGNEKFAILKARKLAKYYARLLPERTAFVEEVNQVQSFIDFKSCCERYFTSFAER